MREIIDKNSFIRVSSKELEKIIKKIYVKDKIVSLYLKLLFVSGARACEIQNLALKDIKKDENIYKTFIKVAKKRNYFVLREVIISKDFFKDIQKAHKEYFAYKDFDYLHRTYLFQKTKHKKIGVRTISSIFKEELQKITRRKINKSLHIFRHNYVRTMKENNANIYEIMNDLKWSDIKNVYKVYGEIFVDRKRNFEIMNSFFKDKI